MKKTYIIVIVLFLVNGSMAQWYPLNSGTVYDLLDVFFTDNNIGYVVGDSGTILKTTDAGTTWNALASGTMYTLTAVYFTSSNTGYAVGNGFNIGHDDGIILITDDGGMTWDPRSVMSSSAVFISDVFFPDNSTGYVSCYASFWPFVEKTTNGGLTWDQHFLGMTNSVQSIFFTDTNTGYAVGFSGHNLGVGMISKTTDGGITWNGLSHPPSYGLSSVFFTDANAGYVVSWQGEIQKTTDGGITWQAQTSGTNGELESVFFPNASTGYIVGYDNIASAGIILRTNDGGTNWTKLSSGTANYLYSVHFTDEETGYAVGVNGTILKTTNGGGPPVGINQSPSTSRSVKVYPNPSSGQIMIETNSKGELSILNLNGKELIRQQIYKANAQIDISHLPAGIYIVKFMNEGMVQVGKIVKE